MEYTGTKSYNKSFTDEGIVDVKVATLYTVENLVSGTKYRFQVYAISKCGTKGPTTYIDEETRLEGKDEQASKQEIAVKMIFYATFGEYMNRMWGCQVRIMALIRISYSGNIKSHVMFTGRMLVRLPVSVLCPKTTQLFWKESQVLLAQRNKILTIYDRNSNSNSFKGGNGFIGP